MLDPGHGGDDQGAKSSKGTLEKDLVLAMSGVLQTALEEAGFTVLRTRTEDVFIPLWDRARLANEAGADIFLSLHLNASRAKGVKGSEVYFLSLQAGDADAAALAELENRGATAPASEPDSIVAGILEDLAQKAYLQESERLAVAIQNQLNLLGDTRQRGVKQAPFAVLRGAAMPAVLVETAFLSNVKEEALLVDPAFHRKVADSIAMGVRRYFSHGQATPKRKAGTDPRTPRDSGEPALAAASGPGHDKGLQHP